MMRRRKLLLLAAAIIGGLATLSLNGCEKKDLDKELESRTSSGQNGEKSKLENIVGVWKGDGCTVSFEASGKGSYRSDSDSYSHTFGWTFVNGLPAATDSGIVIGNVSGNTMKVTIEGTFYSLEKQ
ncbi:MAG: hypothetical protein CSA97_00190 [Bacteroidetes bacterium]|nr:MAG: hypothetical protein CSA97_00190 [Bacteroidota bacterium]